VSSAAALTIRRTSRPPCGGVTDCGRGYVAASRCPRTTFGIECDDTAKPGHYRRTRGGTPAPIRSRRSPPFRDAVMAATAVRRRGRFLPRALFRAPQRQVARRACRAEYLSGALACISAPVARGGVTNSSRSGLTSVSVRCATVIELHCGTRLSDVVSAKVVLADPKAAALAESFSHSP